MTKQQTDSAQNSPAPLWRILAAMAYDSILVLAIWMVVTFLVLSFFGIDNARTVDGDAVTLDALYKNILLAVMVVSAYAFFGWFWTHSGQTLGMQAWRIRVVSLNDEKITFIQSVKRFAMAMVSGLFFGLGFFYILFNANKESLHDKVSGTKLIKVQLMKDKKQVK